MDSEQMLAVIDLTEEIINTIDSKKIPIWVLKDLK